MRDLDYLHLDALQSRLCHEIARLQMAKTERERESRRVTVAGIEREIRGELALLGMTPLTTAALAMSDEELLESLK